MYAKKVLLPLLVIITIAGCYKEENYDPSKVNTAEVLTITADTGIAADGVSYIWITASVPKKADSAKADVKFTTTKGVFVETNTASNTINAVSAGIINGEMLQVKTRLLASTKIDTAELKVAVSNFDTTIQIYFVAAPPDWVEIVPSAFTIKPTFASEVTINAFVRRLKGTPTQSTKVKFETFDSIMQPFGYRRDEHATSDSNGKTSTVFSPGNTSYTGKVYIRVTTDNSKTAIDSIFVYP